MANMKQENDFNKAVHELQMTYGIEGVLNNIISNTTLLMGPAVQVHELS